MNLIFKLLFIILLAYNFSVKAQIKESKLDERFVTKMNWANEELNKAKEEASIDFLNKGFYSNQMGEA